MSFNGLKSVLSRLHRPSITPSARAVYSVLAVATLLACILLLANWFDKSALYQRIYNLSIALSVFSVFVLLLDFWGSLRSPRIKVERKVAGSVAVNRWFVMDLKIHHGFVRSKVIEIFDHIDETIESSHFPITVELQAQQFTQIQYKLKAKQRGPISLPYLHLRVPSAFGFWRRQLLVEAAVEIKVYPDFSAISAYTLLGTDNQMSQLGIKRRPRRGEGMDFMQLRDYRRGDSLRQVDWKATSRRKKIISKEYQDERDQQVLLLIDSGRRMRAQDDDLNHFDHALNAALLVSYVALRQGDSVGVMAFGKDYRWLAPQKSPSNMSVLLNGLYDLQTSNSAPDYVMAAQKLHTLQSKRSLIIIVTNSRDEDVEEILMATKLLRKKHLVVLANIREQVVENMQEKPVVDLDSALQYASASHYLTARRETHKSFMDDGIFALDCLSKELPVRVANSYLEIKRSGVL